jgi:phosphate/sulfate permease
MNESFLLVIVVIGLFMLIWDCVEVGRNDAANLINAVFGARVLTRNTAILVAGGAVLLGATFASPVMETARKGIFNPALLTVEAAMVVYITAYIVDTVLLHTYSAFGMPVSTTASLVFELVGLRRSSPG